MNSDSTNPTPRKISPSTPSPSSLAPAARMHYDPVVPLKSDPIQRRASPDRRVGSGRKKIEALAELKLFGTADMGIWILGILEGMIWNGSFSDDADAEGWI